MKKDASMTVTILIALFVVALATVQGITLRGKRIAESERDAYAKVSQECGVIRINQADGKKYVSFAFRVQRYPTYHEGETPEFLAALESLKYVDDLRGVNIDDLPVTMQSLQRLSAISTLEEVYARGTYLTDDDAALWQSRPAQSGKPPVKLFVSYDELP